MGKNIFMLVVSGLGIIYLVIHFIGDIQKDDDTYSNDAYKAQHQYDKYNKLDSIGEHILDLTDASSATQVGAWNSSVLKGEFLNLFPDFDEMKHFINDRLRGKIIKDKLTKKVNDIESKFIAGIINDEEAKRELSKLK